MGFVSREGLAGIARSSSSCPSSQGMRTTQPRARSISMHRRDSREHAGTTPCRRDATARAHEPQAICHFRIRRRVPRRFSFLRFLHRHTGEGRYPEKATGDSPKGESVNLALDSGFRRNDARTHPGMPIPLRDAIKRPGLAYSLIVKMRGVARQKAQSVMDRDLSEIARAPLGAPCAAFMRTPGRAFRSGEKPEVSQLLAGTRISPGRSPGAARELRQRAKGRGRRTSSRLTTPREAPLSGRGGMQCKGGLGGGDKVASLSPCGRGLSARLAKQIAWRKG